VVPLALLAASLLLLMIALRAGNAHSGSAGPGAPQTSNSRAQARSAISDIEWRLVPSVTNQMLRDVHMVSETDGWAVGNNATLLRYDGTSWAPFPITTQEPGEWLVDVHMLGPNDGFILGWGSSTGGGNVYRWNGTQWNFVYATDRDPNRVDAVAPNDVWVAGLGRIYHWNGNNWTVSFTESRGRNIFAIQMVTANEGWAVGANQFMAHYLNGTWTVLDPSPAPQTLYDCFFRDGVRDDGWAVGIALDNYVLHYDGVNWTWQFTPTFQLHRIFMLASNDGWAIGPNTIAHYDGTDFTPVNNPAPSWLSLNGIFMRTPTDGWIVGEEGVMLHSYDTAGTPTPTNTPSAPTPTPTPCTISFSDVPPNHTFYPFIRCLACRGIIGGYADGTFRPGNPTTRGQMAKIIANAAGILDPIPPNRQTFSDVPPGHTFWVYIERLSARGIVGGYADGTFRPDNWVTRGQLTKFAANAAGFSEPIPPNQQTYTDVPPTHTFWEYVERLSGRGVISGYQCGVPPAGACDPQNRAWFLPDATVTRGQTSKIVANTFYPNCQTP
jgi:photosystem II stability/assembly factor-like uncharacterized protein